MINDIKKIQRWKLKKIVNIFKKENIDVIDVTTQCECIVLWVYPSLEIVLLLFLLPLLVLYICVGKCSIDIEQKEVI